MTHDFTGKAIFCQTWQQMLHLAKLARKQGYRTDKVLFNEQDFRNGHAYFFVEDRKFMNVSDTVVKKTANIPYTTFITPPTEDSVYGC